MMTLRRDSCGTPVDVWQRIVGVPETNVFDRRTVVATLAWQRAHGLTPDGVVGPQTWAAAGYVDRALTADIDDAFFVTLRGVASELDARPRDLLAVMYAESQCRADAWNDNPKSLPPEKRFNASGLIQFMPPTLLGLGWKEGHAAFRRLSATDQLPWVLRYLRPHRGWLGTVAGVYLAVFLPAFVRQASNSGLVLSGSRGPLAWAYGPNASFDANQDGAITVGELAEAVARNAKGPRWDQLLERLEATEAVTVPELPNT